MRATKAVIHLDYFKENIRTVRSFSKPGTKMCVPVKADAYGHGAVECAKAAVDAGADFLSVAAVDEGVELRKCGIKAPILLFSLCDPSEVCVAVENDITPFVFDGEYIKMFDDEAAAQGKKKYPVHLAVDTGMGRIGCLPDEAADVAAMVAGSKNLFLQGTMTHFAASDCKDDASVEYTWQQLDKFLRAVDSIKARGIDPGIRHCSNSAASLDFPEAHLDMIRPGIILYGYDAGDVNGEYFAKKGISLGLKPVMSLETKVSAVRRFAKGSSVGYGRTWTAGFDTDIAVLPIGYGDGFVRRFAAAGINVAINGKNYPVRGRICMDQCMVDIGLGSGVKRWDRVVIFGAKEDGALQTAQDIADMTGTISYEITTVLTRRVPRIYVG